MGRIKPAWYYEKQATEAAARANYYRTRVPPDVATIQSRGASTDLFYRSLLVKDGAEHRVFIVSVPDDTIAKVTAAQAGLATAAPANTVPLSIRGSGVKPTRVHWYKGDATPTRRKTPWNTSVARYYDVAGGRSHYSMPFSKASGAIAASDIVTAFNAILGPAAANRDTLLGSSNGRAYITWETARVSAQT